MIIQKSKSLEKTRSNNNNKRKNNNNISVVTDLILAKHPLTLIRWGRGSKWPAANENNYYFSATGCPIDLNIKI